MKAIKIAVKEMAQFMYMSGDLSNHPFFDSDMLEGQKVHRFWQAKYQATDQKEYYLKYVKDNITITGYIDGVLQENGEVVVEEIKSTACNLQKIDLNYKQAHLMQLKIYGYLYSLLENRAEIKLKLTYIHIDTYEHLSFYETYSFAFLQQIFDECLKGYLEWHYTLLDNQEAKMVSINDLVFPFSTYRKNQREFMKYCYETIVKNEVLYAIAPTGIGKTMAVLFSSLKALKDPHEKLFYLTAKNLGKQPAIEAVKKLNLQAHTIEITAKDRICFLDVRNCDPLVCPYAKGFYTKLKDATFDIYHNELLLTTEVIKKYAIKHQLCPFEYSLYVSYFADIIICDYNYAFDPRTHLIRYFDDKTYKPFLLVDEAHNLIDRSRKMYSANINKPLISKLPKLLTGIKPSIRKDVKEIVNHLTTYDEVLEKVDSFIYQQLDIKLIELLKKVNRKLELLLSDNKEFNTRNDVITIYFEINRFIKISEFYNDSFIYIVEKKDYQITISCLDASDFILDTVKNKAYGTIFFSATMYPLPYYQKLLTKDYGDYLMLNSPFKKEQLKLIITDEYSTRYVDRQSSIEPIIETITSMVSGKVGNYIVFFPSYKYLQQVVEQIGNPSYKMIVQTSDLTDDERIEFLASFNESNQTKVGFFVMGGMFSEGIDYLGDMLIGVMVVSTGLPMVNVYNNYLQSFFDNKFNAGFDYAYTYPGYNKVIQAVGRVIRSENDYGVVILFDDRFTTAKYLSLMIDEWRHYLVINDQADMKKVIREFWQKRDFI